MHTNVILVAVLLVALNVNTKNILNGILVAVEGGTGQLHTLTHIRFQPTFVNLGKRYLSGLIDGIYQPDVLFEFIISGHRLQNINAKILLFLTICKSSLLNLKVSLTGVKRMRLICRLTKKKSSN